MNKNLMWAFLCLLVKALPCAGADVEVELVSPGSDINLSVLPVSVLGSQGLFCALGNEIVAISSTENSLLTRVELPDSVHIDQFAACGDKIVIRDGRKAMWLDSDGNSGGSLFPDDEFDIMPASDSTFYVLTQGCVAEFKPGESVPVRTVIMPEQPVAAAGFGSGLVVATQSSIRLVIPESVDILHRHPLPIRSLSVGSPGIFFCTETDLWRLEGIDTLEHIASGSFDRLLASGPRLYLIDSSGSLYLFDYTEALKSPSGQ